MNAAPAVTGLLDRLVSAKPGEMPALVAAFTYNFLLFTAYYILRPLRDSMGVAGGVENLDDLFGFTLIGMLLAVPVYGWISGRFRRAVFLPWIYVFFVVQLLGFWLMFRIVADDAPTARVFFVWVSVFNLFVDVGVLEFHGGPVRPRAGRSGCSHSSPRALVPAAFSVRASPRSSRKCWAT